MRKLAQFIRTNQERIIGEWIRAAEARLSSTTGQARSSIRDSLPDVLRAIERTLVADRHAPEAMAELVEIHAVRRYAEGYHLREIVIEYQILRGTILRMYDAEVAGGGEAVDLAERTRFNDIVDDAIADAVGRFAEERDRSREMFVGILAHDLRAPLNTIFLTADGLLEGEQELEPRLVKPILRISRSARRMADMIRDLLDFARGRLGGGIPISPAPTNIYHVVHGVIDEMAAVSDRRIELVTAPEAGDFIGRWDEARLAQVVSNLAANALTHGGDPIVVEVIDRGEAVRVAVRSQGALPEETVARLFDPFHARSATARDRGEGLGLGLYIVSEIARSHGGRVDVDTEPTGTTTVWIELPRDPPGR